MLGKTVVDANSDVTEEEYEMSFLLMYCSEFIVLTCHFKGEEVCRIS